MAEYIQRGKRRCLSCKIETTKKQCPQCGHSTVGSGDWTVRFKTYENGKIVYKRLSNHYKTKKDAEEGMMKYLELHRKANSCEANYTYDELLNKYFDYKKDEVKESTIYTLQSRFNNYITPFFTGKILQTITKQELYEWISKLKSESIKNSYIHNVTASMFSFLNWVENIYDISNQLKKLPRVKKGPLKEMQFFDDVQWKKFQDAVKDDIIYDTMFNFLYFMGTRIGETISLSDNDIDFKNNVVHINKSLTRKTSKSSYKITSPKNKNSNRDISMPDIIVTKLKNYLSWKKEQGIESTFLFGGTKPILDSTYTRKFQYYCKKAELPIIRIHDLRHSNASLLINSGANVILVAKRLGHSNPTETLNRYAKLFRSAEDEIIKRLNNF